MRPTVVRWPDFCAKLLVTWDSWKQPSDITDADLRSSYIGISFCTILSYQSSNFEMPIWGLNYVNLGSPGPPILKRLAPLDVSKFNILLSMCKTYLRLIHCVHSTDKNCVCQWLLQFLWADIFDIDLVTHHYHCSTDWLYSSLSDVVQYSFIHNVILQFSRCTVITARSTGGKRKELKMRTQRSSSGGGRVRNIRRRRQRVGDGVPATHCTRRQPASGTRNRPSPSNSCRTRLTFRNRAVRQTAATKPPKQQRVQLSSDSGGDRV